MSKIYRIVPAILTDSPNALCFMARQAERFAERVQIDVMDGRFVPSHSIVSNDIVKAGVKNEWEAHLMVLNPAKLIEGYARAGAKRIIVHYEATQADTTRTIQQINSLGIAAGLAINPETPLGALTDDIVRMLESVLFMAVHPGYYGAKFIPEVLDKIQEFIDLYPNVNVGIDGGIKLNNISQVADTGVNEICVGSAIFNQPDPGVAYQHLTAIADKSWSKFRKS
jgi:ribulose-phosphate 3-epimerase